MPTLGFNGSSQPDAAATTATAGRNWLALASARKDPMMTFLWDVFPAFPQALGNFAVELIEEIQLPLSRFDVDNVFYQGQRFYFAKFEEYSPVSIKFYEDNQASTLGYFYAWKQLIRDASGNYGLPSDYKGSMTITPLDQTNQVITSVLMYGMFPTSFGNLVFNSGNGRQEITMDFQIDSISIQFNASSDVAANLAPFSFGV